MNRGDGWAKEEEVETAAAEPLEECYGPVLAVRFAREVKQCHL